MLLRNQAFWDVTMCRWVSVSRCFDGTKVFLKPSALEEGTVFFGNGGLHRVASQKALIFNVMLLLVEVFVRRDGPHIGLEAK
jgi:hypothetical protein